MPAAAAHRNPQHQESQRSGLTAYQSAVLARHAVAPDIGESGLMILLDLYAHAGKRPVMVSSACLASGGPATTGLRWLSVLVKKGLAERVADPNDGRRVNVVITPAGMTLVERWMARASIHP